MHTTKHNQNVIDKLLDNTAIQRLAGFADCKFIEVIILYAYS